MKSCCRRGRSLSRSPRRSPARRSYSRSRSPVARATTRCACKCQQNPTVHVHISFFLFACSYLCVDGCMLITQCSAPAQGVALPRLSGVGAQKWQILTWQARPQPQPLAAQVVLAQPYLRARVHERLDLHVHQRVGRAECQVWDILGNAFPGKCLRAVWAWRASERAQGCVLAKNSMLKSIVRACIFIANACYQCNSSHTQAGKS